MPERRVRAYRLDIVYPEGCREPGWHPAVWANPEYLRTLTREQRREIRSKLRRPFKWPRERLFLSSSGAYNRAWLLRFYGADADVLASDPVTWPNLDVAGDWEYGTTAARHYSGAELLADINAERVEEETFSRLMELDGLPTVAQVMREHAQFYDHYFERCEAARVQDR
jgi:hypothetical protein